MAIVVTMRAADPTASEMGMNQKPAISWTGGGGTVAWLPMR